MDYTLSRGAETLAEIEGPTAEATSGGLHSPSSFDITWEDGIGQSSASLPPNEIAWAETKGSSLGTILAIGVASAVGYFGYKKMAASKVDDKKAELEAKKTAKAERANERRAATPPRADHQSYTDRRSRPGAQPTAPSTPLKNPCA